MRTIVSLAVLLLGCGEPVLRNAPRPNPAIVAGAAAAVAGAATLANPAAAGKAAAEANKPDKTLKPQKSKGDVPPDVLDRLDEKQKQKPAAAAPKQPEPAQP